MGVEKSKRPQLYVGERTQPIKQTSSTQLSTTAAGVPPVLDTMKTHAIASTSTASPAYFFLDNPKPGDYVQIGINTIASSSQSPLKVQTRGGQTFDGTNDVVTLSSAGASFCATALSTSRWLTWGGFGGALTTST